MTKNKIKLPFNWDYNLPSVAVFQFKIDLEKLADESNDMSEFPSFFIDLSTGEILGVSDEIATGDAYMYDNVNWLIEGNGWWIGYSESLDEKYAQLPNKDLEIQLLDLFETNKQGQFEHIVNLVCDFARENDLKKLKSEGIYGDKINNEDSPSL